MPAQPDASPVPGQPRARTFTRRGIIGSVVVLIIALICVRLGIWQLHRLQEKRTRNTAAHIRMKAPPLQLTAQMRDSTGLLYHRAVVSGAYDDERTVIVAGRTLNGTPGVHVLTPLRVGNIGVLVNRGWLPSADAATVDLSKIRQTLATNDVGLVLDLPYNPRSPEPDSSGAFKRVWYRFNIAELQRQFPYPLADYVVQLLPAANAPALPRRLEAPVLDEGPHLGYAVQWFSFAVIGIVGWLILMLRGNKKGG